MTFITVKTPISSAIANADKNTLSDNGTLLPNNASTPSEKALSAAIRIPQPYSPSDPRGLKPR
jgi:hypothetical protein